MIISYNGQLLDLHKRIDTNDHSFHNEDSLWATSPEQRSMFNMKFVGGYPNEWCIDLKDVTDEYSIETYKYRIVALIIKENDRYQVYMENGTSFPLGGNNLEEAHKIFWNFIAGENRYGVLVFDKYRSVVEVKCPSCGHEWGFDEENIPNGEIYECSCLKCGALLKRKKI